MLLQLTSAEITQLIQGYSLNMLVFLCCYIIIDSENGGDKNPIFFFILKYN